MTSEFNKLSLAWVAPLTKERPWEVNEITALLLKKINDKDMAAVIWAYAGMNSRNWIEEKMPALEGKSIHDFLQTDDGRQRIWKMLEQAGAWL